MPANQLGKRLFVPPGGEGGKELAVVGRWGPRRLGESAEFTDDAAEWLHGKSSISAAGSASRQDNVRPRPSGAKKHVSRVERGSAHAGHHVDSLRRVRGSADLLR
jgi:hypothetical protein